MKSKIIHIVLWVLISSGFIVSLGFVNGQEQKLVGKSLVVYVSEENGNNFIDADDLVQLIGERGDTIRNQPLKDFKVYDLESSLNSHPAIAKSEVTVTIDGRVIVQVKQRNPILRVIDRSNESYYIDDEGKLMPLSEKFTAKVPVINGEFSVQGGKFSDTTLLGEFYKIGQFIYADTFWKSQVESIYYTIDKEYELLPRVGKNRIVFGTLSDMDDKFAKLLIFYKEGMGSTGWWNNYSVINLKFKNQIVCTKKNI